MSEINEGAFRKLHGAIGAVPLSTIAVSGTSQQSAALTPGVMYSIDSTVDVHVLRAANPTATSSHQVLCRGFRLMTAVAVEKLAFLKVSGQDDGIVTVTALPGYLV